MVGGSSANMGDPNIISSAAIKVLEGFRDLSPEDRKFVYDRIAHTMYVRIGGEWRCATCGAVPPNPHVITI